MPDAFTLPNLPADRALDWPLLDVRKAAARMASGQGIVGADWIDPFDLDHHHPATRGGPVAVFCVHGHEVSSFATALLRLHGRDARQVQGGFDALIAAGAPLDPLT